MLAGVRGVFPLRGLFIPCPLTVDGDVSSLTSLPRGNYLASGLQWFTLGREKEATRSWLKLHFSPESFVCLKLRLLRLLPTTLGFLIHRSRLPLPGLRY
jgi:hypothetical protein